MRGGPYVTDYWDFASWYWYDDDYMGTIRWRRGTGEDLAQGVGFWYAFLTSFWGPKTMVLSKREGLLPGPGLAL